MNIIDTNIPDVKIIEPRVFGDARGYFFESFSERDFFAQVAEVNFVQDNESFSRYGVLRGLHFQRPPFTQAKLVRCVQGAVLDVAVDIRKGSPTYGQHAVCLLCGRDEQGRAFVAEHQDWFHHLPLRETGEGLGLQFFIPHGFAHGFAVLSETALFQYKCDNFYHPEADGGISILDPALGIDWGLDLSAALLSDKDTHHPLLADFASPFTF